MEPVEQPERFPKIKKEEVRLVCWLAKCTNKAEAAAKRQRVGTRNPNLARVPFEHERLLAGDRWRERVYSAVSTLAVTAAVSLQCRR